MKNLTALVLISFATNANAMFAPVSVPESPSLILLVLGILGLVFISRKRK